MAANDDYSRSGEFISVQFTRTRKHEKRFVYYPLNSTIPKYVIIIMANFDFFAYTRYVLYTRIQILVELLFGVVSFVFREIVSIIISILRYY